MIGGGRGQGVLRRRAPPAVSRGATTAPRRRRRRRLPRPGPRFLGALVVLAALLVGGWFWLRDSSLVAVRRVTIAGVSGPDAPQIRLALRSAAREMTTLNVTTGAIHTAVAPYPVVKHVSVSTDFPHGMHIQVVEQVPVAMISAGGRQTAVSADGTLLHDTAASIPLPSVAVTVAPGGTRVTGAALDEVRLLAAAPYPLLAKVAQASTDPTHGLVPQLRDGPKLYFGASTQLGRQVDRGRRGAGRSELERRDVHRRHRPRAPGGGTQLGHRRESGRLGLERRLERWRERHLGECEPRHERRLGERDARHDGDFARRLNLRSRVSLANRASLRYRREFGDLQRSLRKRAHR